MTSLDDIMKFLRSHANSKNVEGMKRYGIKAEKAFGVPMPALRALAKRIGRDHALARRLWATGIHECRILAALTGEPEALSMKEMEQWALEINSWDICDQCCMNLFEKTPYAYEVCVAWSSREEEFVKRVAFSMMAHLAVSDKKTPDARFRSFLPIIKREAADERNFIKKAVNWALRQIGKRNTTLNIAALKTAEQIARLDSKAARWIAADAIRELKDEKILRRMRERELRPRR